jgi:hypothetical protein
MRNFFLNVLRYLLEDSSKRSNVMLVSPDMIDLDQLRTLSKQRSIQSDLLKVAFTRNDNAVSLSCGVLFAAAKFLTCRKLI